MSDATQFWQRVAQSQNPQPAQNNINVVQANPAQKIVGVTSAQPTQKITGVTQANPTQKISGVVNTQPSKITNVINPTNNTNNVSRALLFQNSPIINSASTPISTLGQENGIYNAAGNIAHIFSPSNIKDTIKNTSKGDLLDTAAAGGSALLDIGPSIANSAAALVSKGLNKIGVDGSYTPLPLPGKTAMEYAGNNSDLSNALYESTKQVGGYELGGAAAKGLGLTGLGADVVGNVLGGQSVIDSNTSTTDRAKQAATDAVFGVLSHGLDKALSSEAVTKTVQNAASKVKDINAQAGEGGYLRLFDTPKAAQARETLNNLMKEKDSLIYDKGLKPTSAAVKAKDKAIALAQNELRKATQGGYVDLGAAAEDTSKSYQKFRTEFTDRYAPINDLIKGKNIPAEADPYIQARLYAGYMGKVQNRLNDLADILKPAKDILPDVKQYGLLERYEELANRGITKFPNNLTKDSILAEKAALEAKLGPDKMAQIQNTLEGLRDYTTNTLIEAKNAGIISDESFSKIMSKNEKYLPLQRLDYLADQLDNLPRGSNSFSVSSQSLVKALKGSEKEVADPIESIVRNTYKAQSLIERNKVATKVADLAENPDFKDVITKITGEPPAGMEKFSVFRNGVKEEYAVPKGVGDALKGMNAQQADLVTKWARASSSLLRSGATTLNAAFIPSNAIRDFQTATLVSKVGFTPIDWLKGFSEAISQGPDYRAFLESGGGGSGYFGSMKNVAQTTKALTESTLSKTVKTIINPFKLIEKTGDIIELAPRLGVFKKGLSKDLSLAEAAYNARNATVDFAKSGNTMKLLNQWVPFLNARLQGTINTFTAIKDKPISSALKLSALVGAPVVATYLNNTRNFGDVWKDIPQFEKDNNFLVIYGRGTDADGRYTDVVKIPKGDVGKIFGNILENFLSYIDGKDSKSLTTLAIQLASNSSPIDFERNGQLSGQAALSSTLPPAVKAGVEATTNTNLYTGLPIVPDSMKNASPREQYKNNTSPIAKYVGQKLNVSPLQIQNAVGTMTGGLGRQIIDPTKAPSMISGRFSGVISGQNEADVKQEAEKLLQKQTDEKLQLNRNAQKKVTEIEQSSNPKQAFEDLRKQDPALAKEVVKIKKQKDQGWTSADFAINNLEVSNGTRAKFMYAQFQKLNTKEEKAQLWEEYNKKGLLTSKVKDQVIYLLKHNGSDK